MKSQIDYTMVVCTCDAYADAWDPFFTLLKRYWPDFTGQIVLNTETANYRHPGFEILCPQLYKDHLQPSTVQWSRRLRETLVATVKTELVIIFLDDFFLRSPVNTEGLDTCLGVMATNPTIANLLLFDCPKPYTPTIEYPWLVKRAKHAPYLFSLQVGLWRTDRLLTFLRDHESPWYFERWGSIRGRRFPDDFYAVVTDNPDEIVFDYVPTLHGLTLGKWRPATSELFAKEGINLDVSKRGVLSPNWLPKQKRRNWLKTAWNVYQSLRP